MQPSGEAPAAIADRPDTALRIGRAAVLMNETVLLWILGGFAAVFIIAIGAISKLLWDHIMSCRDVRVDLATIKASLAGITHELGDHESGIRKRLHDMQSMLIRLENRRESER